MSKKQKIKVDYICTNTQNVCPGSGQEFWETYKTVHLRSKTDGVLLKYWRKRSKFILGYVVVINKKHCFDTFNPNGLTNIVSEMMQPSGIRVVRDTQTKEIRLVFDRGAEAEKDIRSVPTLLLNKTRKEKKMLPIIKEGFVPKEIVFSALRIIKGEILRRGALHEDDWIDIGDNWSLNMWSEEEKDSGELKNHAILHPIKTNGVDTSQGYIIPNNLFE